MTNLMLTTGRYAEHPFLWKKFDVHLYSVEELCFYIVRNRYLLGMDAFDGALIEWLDRECGLPELAERLSVMLKRKAGIVEFAGEILNSVRYNTQEEIDTTMETLRTTSDMDIYEKHLARADYLMDSDKISLAFDAYEDLKRAAPRDDKALHARILHNEGVMNARLFSFSQAAECFREEYDLTHEPKAYLSFMAAMRLQMTEKEYIEYISSDAKGYQYAQTLEEMMKEAEDAYAVSGEYRIVQKLYQYKNDGKSREYYTLIDKIVSDLKQEYRSIANESD